MIDQKKAGASLSFFNIGVGAFSSIFLTPLLITSLGDESYSIYKVMQSFAGPLIMFNLGVSTIVARTIVKCDVLGDDKLREKQNTLALGILISLVMSIVVAILGGILYYLIPVIYGGNYSKSLIHEGQVIFVIFVISTIFHLLTDAFTGCTVGHERFAFKPALLIIRNILRIPLFIIFLHCGFRAITVSMIDCILSIFTFFLTSGYAICYLKEFPKLTYFDKKELLEILSFSAAILLQAIVNQVNNSVDTMILGAYIIDKQIITMYSSALLIYCYYNSIISIFSGFFLPKATRLITRNATGDELTNFVIKPGRYQAIMSVAIIIGFILLGKEFITIWIGAKYIQAYYVILILIVPVTIPLVENSAISILDASLKRIFRSITLVVMAVVNVVISIVLIRFIGFWGAALGTFISLCIGHIILMNLYYKRTFKMKIIRMFTGIFKGILPMGIIAGLICLPIINIGSYSYLGFIMRGITFSLVYTLLIWKWGMKQEERDYILRPVKNIIRVK